MLDHDDMIIKSIGAKALEIRRQLTVMSARRGHEELIPLIQFMRIVGYMLNYHFYASLRSDRGSSLEPQWPEGVIAAAGGAH